MQIHTMYIRMKVYVHTHTHTLLYAKEHARTYMHEQSVLHSPTHVCTHRTTQATVNMMDSRAMFRSDNMAFYVGILLRTLLKSLH